MRQRGQQILRSTLDDKLKALREEARTGYAKDDIRRTYIKEELYAQRDAREREAKRERERIKEECLADWKARSTSTSTSTTTTSTTAGVATGTTTLRAGVGCPPSGSTPPPGRRSRSGAAAVLTMRRGDKTSLSTEPSASRTGTGTGEGGGDGVASRCGLAGGLRTGLLSTPVSMAATGMDTRSQGVPSVCRTNTAVCDTASVTAGGVGGTEGTDTDTETHGLALLGAAWMNDEGLETGENENVLTDGILSLVQQFQAETLPVLEAAAAEFREDFNAERERHRVIERDHLTGMPSLIAVDLAAPGATEEEEEEAEEARVMGLGLGVEAAMITPTTAYDVFALTPQRGDADWRDRAASVRSASRRGSFASTSPSLYASGSFNGTGTIDRFTLSSGIPVGGGLGGRCSPSSGSGVMTRTRPTNAPAPRPPRRQPRHGEVVSGLVVAQNEAQGILRSLKRQGISFGGSTTTTTTSVSRRAASAGRTDEWNARLTVRRTTSASSLSPGGDTRPTTTGGGGGGPSLVARVVRPMLLLVCNHCRRCFDCDATAVVLRCGNTKEEKEEQEELAPPDASSDDAERHQRLEIEVSCPTCHQRVGVGKDVLDHYATRLFPAPAAAAAAAPRGLLYTCDLDEDGHPASSSSGAAGDVGTEVRHARQTSQTGGAKKKNTATTSTTTTTTCGVGTGDENAYESEETKNTVDCASGVDAEANTNDGRVERVRRMVAGEGGTQTDANSIGTLPFPIALPHAVKGIYFAHLWDLWEAEQDQLEAAEV